MSETKSAYTVAGEGPQTLAAFKHLACVKPYCSGDYVPPTAQEVRALRSILSLSAKQVALITGASWNEKGSTTVRKWTTDSEKEYRQIPYAAWRQLLEFAGLVSIDDVILSFERHGK